MQFGFQKFLGGVQKHRREWGNGVQAISTIFEHKQNFLGRIWCGFFSDVFPRNKHTHNMKGLLRTLEVGWTYNIWSNICRDQGKCSEWFPQEHWYLWSSWMVRLYPWESGVCCLVIHSYRATRHHQPGKWAGLRIILDIRRGYSTPCWWPVGKNPPYTLLALQGLPQSPRKSLESL